MAEPDPEPSDQEESTLAKLGDFVRRIVQVPKHEVDETEDPKA
jgi:hypothetical protein